MGTALVEWFTQIEEKAERDPDFMDVIEDADAFLHERMPARASVEDLLGRTARMDELNLRLRQLVQEYGAPEKSEARQTIFRRRFGNKAKLVAEV